MTDQQDLSSADELIQVQQDARVKAVKRNLTLLAIVVAIVLLAFVLYVRLSADEAVTTGFDEASQAGSGQSSRQQEIARERYKTMLAEYEANTAPSLIEMSQGQWGAALLKDIAQDHERSLALFANAQFMQATSLLESVNNAAQKHIADWQQAYNNKLSEALQYYRNNQVQQARLALAQADRIIADDAKSDLLRAQLSAYDKVEGYLSQLAVARVENDLEKQVALMQQVLDADPTRTKINEPLEQAVTQLKQNRLSFALLAAQNAFEQGNTSEAKSYIQQAEKIDSSAKGISSLRAELNAVSRSQSLEDIKSEVVRLQSSDNWQLVNALAQRGLSRFSSDAELLGAQEQSSQVLASKRRLDQFIARPDRLSDANIRQAAQDAIAQSITLLPLSQSLANSAQTLASYIEQYASKVEVTVLSDGKTQISVLGVGVVGTAAQKIIELTPGSYTLEGKRSGYRTKRVELSVSIGEPFTVKVICDEKI